MKIFSVRRWAASAAVVAMCASSGAWAAPVTSVASTASTTGASSYVLHPVAGLEVAQSFGMTGFAGANSYADQLGAYGVSAMAAGEATSTAKASLLYTLTNTSAVAQAFSMSFDVFAGSLSNATFGGSWSAGETLLSAYQASVMVGSTALFNSGATLTTDGTGSTLVLTGTRLNDGGDDGTDGKYAWSAANYLLSLGTIGAGQSLSVLASVNAWAQADTGMYYTQDFAGDLNKGACMINDTPYCVEGTALAVYGDPVSFSGGSGNPLISAIRFSSTAVASNEVPEPATGSLIVLAVGLLAWQKRRQQR